MSTKTNTYDSLFNPSGCLTRDSLKRYIGSGLDNNETELAEKHLSQCRLCADALEGLKLIKDPVKINSIVAEIKEDLLQTFSETKASKRKKEDLISNRVIYFSAAASIIILVGLFGYLKFIKPPGAEKIISLYSGELMDKIPPVPVPQTNQKMAITQTEAKSEADNMTHQKPEKGESVVTETSIQVKDESSEEVIETKNDPIAISVNSGQDSGTVLKSTGTEVTFSPEETTEFEAIDIVSTQPVEYYLGEVIISVENKNRERKTKSSQKEEQGVKLIDGISVSSSGKQKNIAPIIKEPTSEKINVMQTTEENADEILNNSGHFFRAVDTMPEFPGGIKAMNNFLKKNLNYPDLALENQTEGTIYISFIIEETGKITSVRLIRGIGSGCDEEAINVVRSMPDWIPGHKDGKPVSVMVHLPITLQIY